MSRLDRPINPITIQHPWISAEAKLNSAIKLIETNDAASTLQNEYCALFPSNRPIWTDPNAIT